MKTACYTGTLGSAESLCSFESLSLNDRAKIVTKSVNSLGGGESLTVVVSFPKNIVAVLEPKAFVSFWNTFVDKLVSWLLSLLALIWYVGLPFFIILKWLRSGRDPLANSGQVQA